jgi:hypothetical protein
MHDRPSTIDHQRLSLYEQDYYLWLITTSQQLRQGNLVKVDLPNLIEEIEDMGRSERKAIRSNLRILLMHLLKYKYQPEKRSNSWLFAIREHRQRLRDYFRDSPSLKPYCQQIFNDCDRDARELASDETGLSIDTFSNSSIFSLEETLNTDLLPE